MNPNQRLNGVRLLSALRNPALFLSAAVVAVGCMESPTRTASPAGEAVTATAARVEDSTRNYRVYQAEAASIIEGGAEVGGNASGYTGTSYVGFPYATGGLVAWIAQPPLFVSKNYSLTFRYSNGSSAVARAEVKVNGKVYPATINFPRTGSWSAWSTVTITQYLLKEPNDIRIMVTSTKGLDLDKLTIK